MVKAAENSEALEGHDKGKTPSQSRMAVVTSDAEPANCHELQVLITLVFAHYAYKPLRIHLLETG
jgi:hypothetical protein